MMRFIYNRRAAGVIALLALALPVINGVAQVRTSRDPEVLISSIVAYCVGAALLALPSWSYRQLPLLPTMLSVLFVLIAVERGYRASPVGTVAGQPPWFSLGYLLVIFVLGARLRFWWATFVWAVVAVLSLTRWTSVRGTLVITETYTVVGLATLFATWLAYQEYVRFSQRQRETRRMLLTARSHDEAEKDNKNASFQRVQEVRRLAGGLLERIAHDPSEITAYDVNQLRLTEAQLRDTIRGRSIATPYLLEITRTARDRGVVVDILDERGERLPPRVMAATTEQVAAVLNAAKSGSVTIRAFPEGDPTAVFIVHDAGSEDEDPVAIEIAAETGEVSRF